MNNKEVVLWAVALVSGMGLPPGAAMADIKLGDNISFYGDIRIGYYTRHREKRDATHEYTKDFRARIRPGLKFTINDNWSGAVRFAGRYSTDSDKNNNHFEFFSSIPTTDGLRYGDSTIDTMFVHYQQDNWGVQLGRFQYKKELEGVARKSLIHNNSANVEINWTDGIRAHLKTADGWKWDGIVHHAQAGGPTLVRRSPISYSEKSSHLEYYIGVEKNDKNGFWLQRSFDFTYIPNALRTDGTATGRIDDIAVVTGRVAMQWLLDNGNTRFIWANALGYSFNAPRKTTVKTGTSGYADAVGLQTSINWTNIWPGHSFGIVYVRAGGGYLMSPDVPNNSHLLEGRWRWKLARNQKFEVRYRVRKDIKKPVGVTDKRDDTDMYFRWTLKF